VTLLDKVEPLSKGQEEFMEALKSEDYDIIGVFGPTGTGKSLLSICYGIDSVTSGKYKRFIISRPVVDVVTGREVTAVEAGKLYFELASQYLRDILEGILEWKEVLKMLDEGKVVFADTHYLRGRTFDNSIVFIDDTQAMPPESVLEILVRMGRNSRLIIAGDPIFQKTAYHIRIDSATLLRNILLGEERAKVVDLGLKDIVRPGARRGIKLFFEAVMRKRELNDIETKILDSAHVNAPDADIVTVIEFIEAKKTFEIKSEHTPDALIIVKEGHIGRIVGRGGERIEKIEQDTEFRIRAIELTLYFKEFIRAVHPISWIHKHIVDAEFKGSDLVFQVREGEIGPFVGQRGFHIKFLDYIMKKLIGVNVRVEEVREEEKAKRAKRRRRK